jgi:DNA helicase TIP49 (TBP-interacting protein)
MKEVIECTDKEAAKKKATELGCNFQFTRWLEEGEVYCLLKYKHRVLKDKTRKAVIIKVTNTKKYDILTHALFVDKVNKRGKN